MEDESVEAREAVLLRCRHDLGSLARPALLAAGGHAEGRAVGRLAKDGPLTLIVGALRRNSLAARVVAHVGAGRRGQGGGRTADAKGRHNSAAHTLAHSLYSLTPDACHSLPLNAHRRELQERRSVGAQFAVLTGDYDVGLLRVLTI